MSEELKERWNKIVEELVGWNHGTVLKGYDQEELIETLESDTREYTDQLLELFESYARERELKVWSQVLHTDSIVSDQLPLPDWVDEALAGTSILDMVGNGLESQKKA